MEELTTASFSHDPTGKAARLDRFMGVEDGRFFLSHGGFVEGFTPYGVLAPPSASHPGTCPFRPRPPTPKARSARRRGPNKTAANPCIRPGFPDGGDHE